LAAVLGVLALAAALAAGHLVAGLVGINASPYLAVGNGAIDLTPVKLKDFAVRAFGTYDKLVLLSGMAVVLVVVSAVAGLVSRRKPWPGLVMITAFGHLHRLALRGAAGTVVEGGSSRRTVLPAGAEVVGREATFNYGDIRDRPLVERTITLTCVSNEVGGTYVSTANFIGVDLADLLEEAGVRPGAEQLHSTSADGWTSGSPVTAAMDRERGAVLAIGMNGEPLPIEHGFPARLVIPGLYGYVSATKWVTDLEVTTWQARQAYWLKRGWSREAPIKTESRIDTPKGFETVPSGKVRVAGIAWASTPASTGSR
jgi:hypothetical protein